MNGIVIVQQSGRLGNQLHMYAATQEIFKNRIIVYLGFNDLNHICTDLKGIHIKSSQKISFKRTKKYLEKLAESGIISNIFEKSEKSIPIHEVSGLLSKIYYAKECYFQNNWSIEQIKNPPEIKNLYKDKAKSWIERNAPLHATLIFLHIRRGDYLYWPSETHPAVLSMDYYKNAMSMLRNKVPNPHFIIMGDDQKFMHDNFFNTENCTISQCDHFTDLCIMKNCTHGILSASTFAWWGAFLSRSQNNFKENLFIAPKYWAGHTKKEWYPNKFSAKWINYI